MAGESPQAEQSQQWMDRATAVMERHGRSIQELPAKVRESLVAELGEIAKLRDEVAGLRDGYGKRFRAIAEQHDGTRTYKGCFHSAEQAKVFGKFIRAAVNRDHAAIEELQEKAALSTQTGAGGGFLAPTALVAEFINNVEKYGVFERNSPFVTVESEMFMQPKRAQGATVYYPDYGGEPSESALTFAKVEGKLPRWSVLVIVDRWMLRSNLEIALAEYVVQEMSRALAQAADTNGFVGTGGDTHAKITGAFKTGNANVVTADSGDDTFQEVIDGSVKYLGKVVGAAPDWTEAFDPRWYMHRTIFWGYMAVRDSQNRPIADIFHTGERPQAVLLSYPVEMTQVAPKLSDSAVSTVMAVWGGLRAAYGAYRFTGGIDFSTLEELKRLKGQVVLVADVLQTIVEKDGNAIVQLKTAAS